MTQQRIISMTARTVAALAACLCLASGTEAAQSFEADVKPLVEASCLTCHGDRTVTPLNLARLGFDLGDRKTYRAWERVYERLEKGEMPPAAARQPEAPLLDAALGSLKLALVDANLAARGAQRTPLRRLTRLEYAYTLEDLLAIDGAVAEVLSQTLPAEADSGGFDTVAANQSMSPLHVRAYLDAADGALDAALRTGPPPSTRRHVIDYAKSRSLPFIEVAQALGLGIVKSVPDGFVAFFDFGSTYTFHSASEGYAVTQPGRYRVTVEAYPYQARTPVTLTVYKGKMAGVAASLDELIGTFDLESPRAVEMRPYLRSGDLIGLSVADLDVPPEAAGYGPSDPSKGYGGMKDYPGEGIAIRSMTIEGPLPEGDAWPPASTRQILAGVEFDDAGEVILTKAPYEHVVDAVEAFAPRAFRRPLAEGELEAYAGLAATLLADGRPSSKHSACRSGPSSAPRRSSSRGAAPRRTPRRRSTTSHWRHGCRTSSGAACRTPRCSERPAPGGCRIRRCSPARSTACSTTSGPRGSCATSQDRPSGSTSCGQRPPTPASIRSTTIGSGRRWRAKPRCSWPP